MELCYFISVKYTILKWSSTLNSCWVCLCVACVCGSESALRCPFSRAALLWELSVFCRQKDSELFLYFLLGHFIFFMRVSILLPGIDQHWHAAQVKGYSWAGLDKRDYAGIPLDPFMEERETPEGCFPNLSAFLSNTQQFCRTETAVLLCLNLWCFVDVGAWVGEREREGGI